ncbi:MAG: glutathione S-transferase family protein [Alphaproteobacteria bacterium]|nr:MAG: glutathione S-transferase family protein [Alphaproteobacteria bacterium]
MRSLFYTLGSPFARAIRVLLHELELDYGKEEELTTPTVEERAAVTPTLQVPTLRDKGTTLWESGLIADYLLSSYPAPERGDPPLAPHLARPESAWEDRLILATAQTLGSAATIISQMRWAGVAWSDNDYLTRCRDRLPHLLGWLEERLPDTGHGFFGAHLSAQDIFLVCHLDFIANRPLDLDPELEKFPKTDALVTRLRTRPSFLDNPILWWDPDVTGYAEDGRTPLYA